MSHRKLFISDLHLSPSRTDLTQLFEKFIDQHTQNASELYILGDLFDAWIGDDNLSVFNKKIATLIRSLSERNIDVYFMPGNRDFLLGENYCSLCHMHLFPDPFMIDIDGNKILLTHGDLFCTHDTNYQNYRAKIQNPKMKKRILKLPLFIRQLLARIMRKKSQHESNQISQDNMKKFDVNLTDLVNYCNKHQVKTVIHGHTHLPGIDLINQLTTKDYQYRFVLSDWHKTGHYLEMKTGCPPTLHHFS